MFTSLRFDITLLLPDRPGELLRALEPIAKCGGNIISIIHDRNKVSSNYAIVSLVADFPSRKNFLMAKKSLERQGISIAKSEEVVEKETFNVIIIGEVDINELFEENEIQILEAEISRPTTGEQSLKLNFEVPKEKAEKAMDKLKKFGEERDLLLITPM